MGCYDIFCLLCGNPCHSMFKESIEFFLDGIETWKNHKVKKYQVYKSWYDAYENDPDIISRIKKLIKETKWMNNCTILTATNKIIHGCKEVDCNIHFKDKKIMNIHMIPKVNLKICG